MLSLASLLNPAPPGPPPSTPRHRPSPAWTSPATSFSSDCTSLFFERHLVSSTKHSKMAKDSGGFVKSKAKGKVNFPPFENLDNNSVREIKRYQIYPFGKIQEYCRHIPYNSGKKDFCDKTGRESFEVFQYIFKVPGDNNEYTVMWDYNVGLVRMTPFFKCCKYSKTQPAKMLNLNPGLRDITHSITGGSIMAQGYWMPFACAKAVCATFCAPIAGALIPIFGPDFPSQCTSPDAPEHGRMSIDPAIVAESAREAELFRRMYANAASVAANSHLPQQHQHHQRHLHFQQTHSGSGGGGDGGNHYSHGPALPSPTSIPSPRLGRRAPNVQQRYRSPHEFEHERMRFKRGPSSPYGTDSEPDMYPGPDMPSLPHPLHCGGMPYSPLSPPRSSGNGPGSSWTVVNQPHPPTPPSHRHLQHSHSSSTPTSAYAPSAYRESDLSYPTNISGGPVPGPNPLLSAIPRFGHSQRLEHQHQHHHHQQPRDPFHHQQRLPPIQPSAPPAWRHGDGATAPHHHNVPIFHPPSAINTAAKRPAAELVDAEYDDCSSDKSSPATTATSTAGTSLCSRASAPRGGGGGGDDDGTEAGGLRHHHHHHHHPASTGAEKNAALLLMNLSVRDHADERRGAGVAPGAAGGQEGPCHFRLEGAAVAGAGAGSRLPRGFGPESMSMSPVSGAAEGHRSKRRRATSM